MRELKFRVWSKEQKTYEYKFPYNSIGDFYVSSRGKVFSDFGNTIAPEVRQDDFIVEQYTGLKDKNGKEIYEGDIVKAETRDKHYGILGKVVYRQCAFWIENAEDTHREDMLKYYEKEVEIIGNIHKDKEFLGDEG